MDGEINGDQALQFLAQVRKKYVCSGEELDALTAVLNTLLEIVKSEKEKDAVINDLTAKNKELSEQLEKLKELTKEDK